MSLKTIGIYKITNNINNKVYIGSSSYSIENRFRRHKSELNRNIHPNKHLQASWNKYGKEYFVFEIIEVCDLNLVITREQYYIDILNPQYNKAPIAGSSLGRKATEETKRKMSLSQKGKTKNLGNTFKRGTKWSEETRKKMLKIKIKDNLGNIYNSIVEASLKTGVKRTTINRSLKFKHTTRSGWKFEYIERNNTWT